MNEIVKNTFESIYRTTIGQLPIIGPVMNELAFDYSGRLKQQRLNNFLEKLKTYFEESNQKEIQIEHILTEDFHDLFALILHKVSLTKSEHKIDRFKNIVINQIKEIKSFESIEIFVEIAGKLTEKHMEILITYYSNRKFHHECEQKISRLEEKQKVADQDYEGIVLELQKTKDKKIGYLYTRNELEQIDSHIEKLQKQMVVKQKKKNDLANKISDIYTSMEKSLHPRVSEEFGLDNSEFEYLQNDLASMYLLKKEFYNTEKMGSFSVFSISEFGISYLEFIKEV